MNAIAYINNVYKLYTNSKLGICEDLDLTFPNLCETTFVPDPVENTCGLTLNPNTCNLTITAL